MTDLEKVLQALEHCDLCSDMPNCPGCAYLREPDCMEHLKRDIIALLKAQEPIKPLKMEVDHVRKEPVVFSYQCPVCMTGLQRHWVACPNCGQAMKWE